jgi:hypothetical protein
MPVSGAGMVHSGAIQQPRFLGRVPINARMALIDVSKDKKQ